MHFKDTTVRPFFLFWVFEVGVFALDMHVHIDVVTGLEIEVNNSGNPLALEDLSVIALPIGLALAEPRVWQNSCGGKFYSNLEDRVAGLNTGFLPSMSSCTISTRVVATGTDSQNALVSFMDFFNLEIRQGGAAATEVNVAFPPDLWVQRDLLLFWSAKFC
ncbi:MAG: hypothetical protein GY822_25530 [Deltaproteobacteria bacterium]|nr:hypothetical protein [Deltaproteobacteria bacterium]